MKRVKKLLFLIILHIGLLSFIQYTAWPENLLWPYLGLHGSNLYKDVFYIYTPLYFWLLTAWDKITGVNLSSLVFINYLIIGVTDILIYRVSKNIKAVLLYVPLQIYFEGNGFWPDQLLAPLFLLIYWAVRQKNHWLIGVVIGLALMTKQTAAYFVLGTGIMLVVKRSQVSYLAKVLSGAAAVLGFVTIWLVLTGNLRPFFEETIKYVLTYHAGNMVETIWPTKYQIVVMLLVFGPATLIGLWRKKIAIVALMFLAALGIFTRFSYFHLQPALPFVALLLAENLGLTVLPYLVFLFIFVRAYLRDWRQPPRFLGNSDYQNALEINQYVRPGERTLIIASQDHYYYLTNTLPVGGFFVSSTPWNLNYPGIQERYIENLTKYRPNFVFLGKCMWEKGVCYQPEKIRDYTLNNFRRVSELPDGTGVFENNPVGVAQ